MKTKKYALKLNGSNVSVKGYSASVRMQVENATIHHFLQRSSVPPATYSEPQSHKLFVMNSNASRKCHDAPSFYSIPPYHQQRTPNHSPMNRL